MKALNKNDERENKLSMKSGNKNCSKCLDMLHYTLSKSTRASRLLKAMNAHIFSNEETGEVGIQINQENNSNNFNRAIIDEKKYEQNHDSNLYSSVADAIIPNPSLSTVATSPSACTLEDSQSMNESAPPIFIQCKNCGNTGAEGGARAYVKGPDPLSMVLCANRLSSVEEIQEVLIHELIHIYDVKFRGVDLRECKQLAYSEIRAAREAECSETPSIFRNFCIKSKATVATKNLFPEQGKQCVQHMFDLAMKDLSPMASSNNDNSKSNYTLNNSNIESTCKSKVSKDQEGKRNFVSSDR